MRRWATRSASRRSGGPSSPAAARRVRPSPPRSTPTRWSSASRAKERCWRRSRGRSGRRPCWSRSRPACSGGLVSPRGGASIRLASLLEPARWAVAAGWAAQVERRRDVPEPLADRLARWATSPWPGIPAFLLVSIAMLLAVIYVGGFLAAALGAAWGSTVSPFLASAVPAVVPVPVLAGSLLWALDGGMLGMLAVGIPYILTFYLLLSALEDSGYLTSAAVLMDRVFGALGLPAGRRSRCWPRPAATSRRSTGPASCAPDGSGCSPPGSSR